MIICSRCGTQNAPSAQACGLCGVALAPSEAPRERPAGPSLSRTMVGQGPPVVVHPKLAQEHDATPAPRASMGRHATMVGLAPPTAVPAHQPHEQGPSTLTTPPPNEIRDGRRTARMSLMNRTFIGIAPPAPRVPRGAPEPSAVDSQESTDPIPSDAAVSPAKPKLPPQVKTMLGVARPGIAPIHPGIPKQEPPAPLPEPAPPPSALPQSRPHAPARAKAAAITALAGAALLLAAGAFVYFSFLRGPGPIEGRASVDAEGRDRLELACSNCEDGRRARLGNQVVVFRAGKAALALASPLRIGDNRFELGVTARDSSRERTVSLSVPLVFRVRGDTTTLAEPAPRLRVLIEAVPKSQVVIDAKPLGLDPQGRGEVSVDVSSDVQGADSGLRRIERKIAYSITPPSGTPSRGTVEFRIGVVPLTLDAPGESITTDEATFVLAGRTQKGGTLSIGERALTVDAEGRFEQTMSVSALGETTVTLRASAKDHAPRLFRIRVRRVASLTEEARALRATSTGSYAALASETQSKRGWKVALDGSVIEVSRTTHRTLLLLDTKSGCKTPPCIARVIYGRPTTFRSGDGISVFGRVQGDVDGPRTGSKIPEIVADFLLKAPR